MRIRGYDEETEELSDDYENISGDIADLTKSASTPGGISLFTDSTKTEYKSTYQILKEISEIWDELTDKNQAELLEKMFGKTRANQGAAILSNFESAEEALQKMESAEGNADTEMDTIRESIEYKLNELKQTWVGVAQDILNRKDIGEIVDSLTSLSSVLADVVEGLDPIFKIVTALIKPVAQLTTQFAKLMASLGTVGSLITVAGVGYGAKNIYSSKKNGIIESLQNYGIINKQDNGTNPENGKGSKNIFKNLFNGAKNKFNTKFRIPVEFDISKEKLNTDFIDKFKEAQELISQSPFEIEADDLNDDESTSLLQSALEGNTLLQDSYDKAKTALEGYDAEEVRALLTQNGLTEVEEQDQLIRAAGIPITEEEILAYNEKELAQVNNMLASNGLQAAETQENLSTLAGIEALEAEILAREGLSVEQRKNIEGYFAEMKAKRKDAAVTSKWNKSAIMGVVATAAVTGAIALFSGMSEAAEEAAEKVTEAKEAYDDTVSNISDYKTKISDLYETINDSSSSISETTSAREELLTIQDELIEKYGSEAGAINNITDAVNGEVDALDGISDASYEKLKLQLSDTNGRDILDNLFGTSLTEIGTYWSSLFKSGFKESGFTQQDLFDNAKTQSSIYEIANVGGIGVSKQTDLLTAYQEVLDAQSRGVELTDEQEKKANKIIDAYEKWGSLYETEILKDEIESNDNLNKQYKAVKAIYDRYEEAVSDGDNDEKESAYSAYTDIIKELESSGVNSAVLTEFKTLYPVLEEEASKWEFKVNFKAATVDEDNSFKTDFEKNFGEVGTQSVDDFVSYYNKAAAQYDEDEIKIDEALINKFSNAKGGNAVYFAKLLKQDGGFWGNEEIISELNNIINGTPTMSQEDFASLLNQEVSNKKDRNDFYKETTDNMAEAGYDSIEEYTEDILLSKGYVMSDNEKEFRNRFADVEGADEFWDKLSDSDREIVANLDDTDLITSLDELKQAIRDAKKSDTDYTTSVSKAETYSEKLDTLMAVYDDVKNGEDFDYSSILNNETFKSAWGSYDGYENFIETITNSPDDIEACQSAFNDLATEAFYSSDAFKKLSEDSAPAVIKMLEQHGVANAAEVVTDSLNALNAETELYNQTGKDLRDVSLEEADSLLNLAGVSEGVNSYLKALYLQQYDLNSNPIDTTEDIEQLIALANAAGTSSEYVEALQTSLDNIKATESYINSLGEWTPSSGMSEMDWDMEYGSKVYNQILDIADEYDSVEDIMAKIKELQLDPADFIDTLDTNGTYDSRNSEDDSSSEEEFNWIERAIAKVQRAYERLSDVVSDTTKSWISRNSALEDSFGAITDEINVQQAAYDYYMQRFNDLAPSEEYKDLIANGAINIETISDEDTADAVSKAQDMYDAAIDAESEIISLQQELRELGKTRFDNISEEFDNLISRIDATRSSIEGIQDIIETRGYVASSDLLEALKSTEQDNLATLYDEYASLTAALDKAVANGIDTTSSDYYDMLSSIDDVNQAILESQNNIYDLDNQLRQLEWDKFDKAREQVTQLVDETEFLLELLDDETLIDEDTGFFTEFGEAAKALHAQDYQTYLEEANAYANEIKRLNSEIANDPANTTLLERRQELLESQREAIKNSISEKDAIKDLIQESYDAQISALNEIIDKYKDLLSTQKDAYDYEKNITEQSENIASLQKQLNAYSGDTSEETQKTVQQLKQSLEDAQTELQDTEYERLISDTENMLDDLVSDLQDYFDEYMQDFDTHFAEIVEALDSESGSVAVTLNNVASEYGTQLSETMLSIWGDGGSIQNVFDTVSKSYLGEDSTINKTLNAISLNIASLYGEANAIATTLKAESEARSSAAADESARQAAAATANNTPSTDSTPSYDDSSYDSGSSGSSSSDVDWIYAQNYYPRDELNIDTSIVDRLKYHNIDSSWDARAQYFRQLGFGEYEGSYDDNVTLLEWIKAHDDEVPYYAKGSHSIKGDQLAWTQEEGTEVIYRASDGAMLTPLSNGDKVFTSEMSENLWKLAQNPNLASGAAVISAPDVKSTVNNSSEVNVSYGDVTMTFPNVENYEDFMKKAQKDNRFERMVQEMTLGQTLGNNSHKKYTF